MKKVAIVINFGVAFLAFVLFTWALFTPLSLPLIIHAGIGICTGWTFYIHVKSSIQIMEMSDESYREMIDKKAREMFSR